MVQFALGWFANPILIDGKYPAIMREKIDSKSSAQGFSESRLPMFSPEQSQMVANSSGLADTYCEAQARVRQGLARDGP